MLAKYTGEDLFHRWADTTFLPAMDSAGYMQREDFFWSPRSVFWHREYVQSDTASGQLDQALRYLDARMLVVGHTSPETIRRCMTAGDRRAYAPHGRRTAPARPRRPEPPTLPRQGGRSAEQF
jgi:hypothetical protein